VTLPLPTEDELAPTLRPLLEASMLPPRLFTDEDLFEWEMEHVVLAGWVCVGHVDRVRDRGRFLTRDLGRESLIVVGDDDGSPRAFHNVCLHRGARLVTATHGRVAHFKCVYHGWTYALDGVLSPPPHYDEVRDFDPCESGLREVRTEVAGGYVFCDLGGEAPPLRELLGSNAALLDRYRVGELALGERRSYEVEANWKAILENYSECYHCPGVHPELDALSYLDDGGALPAEGACFGGSMALRPEVATMSRSGSAAGRDPLPGLVDGDLRRVHYLTVFPTVMFGLHPDYVLTWSVWPRGAARTVVECEWRFTAQAAEDPAFDPSEAVEFWDQVNREDWRVCERTQLGLGSRGYRRGRYSQLERDVHMFDTLVARAWLRASA